MTESIFLNYFFMAIGLFSMIASLTNWEYLFTHHKSQLLLKMFGRKGARIFYILLGLTLFSFGLLSLTGVIVLK